MPDSGGEAKKRFLLVSMGNINGSKNMNGKKKKKSTWMQGASGPLAFSVLVKECCSCARRCSIRDRDAEGESY